MHVCLFDIDGTLLNTGGAGLAAMEAALASEFGTSASVEGIPMAGRTDRAICADLFRFHGIAESDDAWRRFLEAYARHLPRQLAARDGLVMPGIPELLDRLAARGDVLLGLLTGNFPAGARLKLEHYGLDRHFAFGGFGEKHHHRNDVARQAIVELERFARQDGHDVAACRVWVIGDTPADVECGRAINATVVAVCTGFYAMEALQAAEPDHLFVDFGEPERFLTLLQ
ncbi:MAG TPA: haloacid dehalogenase-like hydrolase [Planctomycetaceae bacterium]|nr:haloacid dehalogenase-like hydrolase [Planctomycetaceae bacterium]